MRDNGPVLSTLYYVFAGVSRQGSPVRRRMGRDLIGSWGLHSDMTLVKKHRLQTKKTLIDTLPEMVVSALANHEDFVVTYETDPKTRKKSLYVMTGNLITAEMLDALKKQIARQKEEGSTVITRDWK